TVFFHRRCLFTKRASYINFSHCIPHPKPDISHCNQHIEYTTRNLGSTALIVSTISLNAAARSPRTRTSNCRILSNIAL
ncbi:hypothetical protein, partial [Candidatus Symbiopectobacterium sp.]|uniref:hypothetical protein n=1 Tax=Candidatus Symbiopectobacterium sp. TaxID=2816440 RepID=UPI0025BAF30F